MSDLVPVIEIQPGTDLEVGEEVYFSASKSQYPDSVLLGKARYEWDFGDGYYFRFDPNISTITQQGICCTHYYMKPGDFEAKLKVTVWAEWNAGGGPLTVTSQSTDPVMIAKGIKTFTVETSKYFIVGMLGTITSASSSARYMQGIITAYNPFTGTLEVDVTKTSASGTYNDWKVSFETIPLFSETISQTIHVTGEAPIAGFEIQRAPFHNRIAQYLYVQIPTNYRSNQTTLRVTLEGAKGSSSVLLSKSNLASEEIVLLDHKPLAQGDYVVVAELIDESGGRIPGGLWRDKFSKKYDGIPKVGIDENNSFYVDGELFFPICNFMTDKTTAPKYTNVGVNVLLCEGYYNQHNESTWLNYLNFCQSLNVYGAGPMRGEYFITITPAITNRWVFNHNPDRMRDYVLATKDHPGMFQWAWDDEPNMGGRIEKTYPPTLAAWRYVSHSIDPQHPSFDGFIGQDWSRYYGTGLNQYDYLASASFFGGKKWVQDGIGFDSYPVASRTHASMNFADMGGHAAYCDLIDRLQRNNKRLVPVIPAIQTCKGQATNPWPSITEDQVYMQAWINVIHGAKGVVWFAYFDQANSGRWAAMKKFSDQIKALTPVVLGAEPDRTVTCDANVALNRVDTMIREKDGIVYVFAVRVTEMEPMPEVTAIKYKGQEPDTVTANFIVSGLTGNSVAEVIDEGRQIPVIDGKFTDTFNKCGVHIYRIGEENTPITLNPPINLTEEVRVSSINLKWEKNPENKGLETGFRIYVGGASGQYGLPIEVDGNTTSYTKDNVLTGTYYIALTSVGGEVESVKSEEKIVTVISVLQPPINVEIGILVGGAR